VNEDGNVLTGGDGTRVDIEMNRMRVRLSVYRLTSPLSIS
jgi:hypothetical protein